MRVSPLMLVAAVACSATKTPEPAPTPPAPGATGEPWSLVSVKPDTTDGIKVLVLHDMEGLSGQSDPNTYFFGKKEYPTGQQMLVADINAVVEGLFAGGATAVDVVDGHGSGNPDPDVRRDLLDKRANQILRDAPFDSYFDLTVPKAYDAVAVVGMHGKTGSGGFAAHTITLGIAVLINGRTITETELVALAWGRENVPVIFGSGDDRLAGNLSGMPWIEFVTVKKATAADSAVPRPVAEARAELTTRAKKAVENLKAGSTKAMVVTGPLKAGIRATPPASLVMLDGIPGIAYADSTLTFTADSIGPAYVILEKIVGIAGTGYSGVIQGAVAADPSGSKIIRQAGDSLIKRWFDYESRRWAAPTPSASSGRKYHGPR